MRAVPGLRAGATGRQRAVLRGVHSRQVMSAPTATQAERIAALFGADGERWALPDGRTIDDVCVAAARSRGLTSDGQSRWIFDDGSLIVDDGTRWDIGLDRRCYCMRGAGHRDDCRIKVRG